MTEMSSGVTQWLPILEQIKKDTLIQLKVQIDFLAIDEKNMDVYMKCPRHKYGNWFL